MNIIQNIEQQATRVQTIRSLGAMLDYAIIEGAELRLPMFVFLLRLAKLEMTENVGGDQPHIENT